MKGKYFVRNPECISEVARLMQQITLEYEAAKRGMSGLAYGTAQHAFITARMENMGIIQDELQQLIGEDKAIKLVAQALERA
ncbi:MAG: hypothetical protein JO202_03645 [Ktedonobacteraceae bacterium]|nr:hypothetical protein [Ktedonobacteraceae bacterium]